MDELDENLFEAWHEVSKQLQNKPWAMARRMERASRKDLRVRSKRKDHPCEPLHFRGWDWRCPGRVLATGQHLACGRVCKKLWMPLPAWTIGDYLAGRTGGAYDKLPRYDLGRSRLACAKCWGIRFDPVKSRPSQAWNQFVTTVSGGLLYGREVTRLGDACGDLA